AEPIGTPAVRFTRAGAAKRRDVKWPSVRHPTFRQNRLTLERTPRRTLKYEPTRLRDRAGRAADDFVWQADGSIDRLDGQPQVDASRSGIHHARRLREYAGHVQQPGRCAARTRTSAGLSSRESGKAPQKRPAHRIPDAHGVVPE